MAIIAHAGFMHETNTLTTSSVLFDEFSRSTVYSHMRAAISCCGAPRAHAHWRVPWVHGLMTGTPHASKPLSSRVTIVPRCARTIPAIIASSWEIGRPARRR